MRNGNALMLCGCVYVIWWYLLLTVSNNDSIGTLIALASIDDNLQSNLTLLVLFLLSFCCYCYGSGNLLISLLVFIVIVSIAISICVFLFLSFYRFVCCAGKVFVVLSSISILIVTFAPISGCQGVRRGHTCESFVYLAMMTLELPPPTFAMIYWPACLASIATLIL